MNETKHELPPAMVEAAAYTIHSYGAIDSKCADDLAKATLEAAGVAELVARIEFLEVIASRDDSEREVQLQREDQLLKRIAKLETALRKVVRSQDVVMSIELDEEITELLKPIQQAKTAQARIAELEVSLADAFDWIGHLPKSVDSTSAVSVNDWIHQAAALLEKAPTGAGGK